jgi:hypothetical protein
MLHCIMLHSNCYQSHYCTTFITRLPFTNTYKLPPNFIVGSWRRVGVAGGRRHLIGNRQTIRRYRRLERCFDNGVWNVGVL